MPVGVGALIGAGLASSLLNTAGGLAGNMWSLKQNKELAKYQYDLNMQAWREQNAYNAPDQQMARLQAAGLNPNLVYGSGAVGNTTSGVPEYDRPTADYRTNPRLDLAQTIMQHQQLRKSDAEIAKLQADTHISDRVADTELLKQVNMAIQNEQSSEALAVYRQMKADILAKAAAEPKLLESQTVSNYANANRANQAIIESGYSIQQIQQAIRESQSRILQMSQNMTESQARVAKLKVEASSLLQGIVESKSRVALNDASLWLKQNEARLRKIGINPNVDNPISTIITFLAGDNGISNPKEVVFDDREYERRNKIPSHDGGAADYWYNHDTGTSGY